MRVADLAAMQAAQQNQQALPPPPTEKAQVVIVFEQAGRTSCIARFNKAKDARKLYDRLLKAWEQLHDYDGQEPSSPLVDISNDMFVGTLDLNGVSGICFVDHAAHAGFVPIPG